MASGLCAAAGISLFSGRAPAPAFESLRGEIAFKMLPNGLTESERVQQVYADYDRKGLAVSKWSEADPGNAAMLNERERSTIRLLSETGFQALSELRILE